MYHTTTTPYKIFARPDFISFGWSEYGWKENDIQSNSNPKKSKYPAGLDPGPVHHWCIRVAIFT